MLEIKNEVEFIKQSAATLISVMGGMFPANGVLGALFARYVHVRSETMFKRFTA